MMEFEDQHEVEEEEEMEEEEEEDNDSNLPPTNYESSLPNSSSRPFKMPATPHSSAKDLARSPSPPPLPLSLSFPAGKKALAPARYRECLKNHAVGLGGHAVDGCCEFMPAGPDGSLDALKCAACNCHRNFHRKEVVDPTIPNHHHPQIQTPAISYFPQPHHHHQHQHPVFQFYPYGRASAGAGGGYPQQRPLALPSTSGGGSRGGEVEEAEMISEPMSAMGLGGSSSSGKKRFRTKFTAEQKEKMMELAEKVGWRLQKQDEPLIQQFCDETGVKRHVLKVWMHNNKHTLGKRNLSPSTY